MNVWKDLLHWGYSSDPQDIRVSRKVKDLLRLSQWSSACSVKDKAYIFFKSTMIHTSILVGLQKGLQWINCL